MGKLIIRPGTLEDVDNVQSIANEAKTLPFLGGFTMRDVIVGLYEKNKELPYNIVAELDGKIVGFSDSKNKNLSYTEYDLVAVEPELRRQHIGSAMYTYHLMRSALMGKRFMRDQTIHFNTVMQDGYLPRLGFKHIAGLRYKIRNFSTINWWTVPIEVETVKRFYNLATTGLHDVEFVELDSPNVLSRLEEYYQESKQLCKNIDEIVSLETNRGYVRELLKGEA